MGTACREDGVKRTRGGSRVLRRGVSGGSRSSGGLRASSVERRALACSRKREAVTSQLPNRFWKPRAKTSKWFLAERSAHRHSLRARSKKPPPCPDRQHCSSTPATPWVPRSKKSRTIFLLWKTSTKPPPRNPATPRYARLDRAPIERRARNRSRAAIAVTGRRVHAKPDCLPVLPQSRSLTRIPRIPSHRTGR